MNQSETQQCHDNGCAGALLTTLRAHGVKLHFVGFCGELYLTWRPDSPAALAAETHWRRMEQHKHRIAMLLWAEAGGRN